MKPAASTYVTMGKVGSAYGIHGWLKIQTYTDASAALLDYAPWYISDKDDHWQIVSIEHKRAYKKGLIAKFTGIETPEDARLLTGKMIAVTREQLPQLNKDEYYWSDLIGLTVINKQGQVLGKVVYLLNTGANDVIVIKDQKEHAIPYIMDKVILHVDLAKQEILVDWDLI